MLSVGTILPIPSPKVLLQLDSTSHSKNWSEVSVHSLDLFRGQVFIVEVEYSEEKSEKYQRAVNGLRRVFQINSISIYYTKSSWTFTYIQGKKQKKTVQWSDGINENKNMCLAYVL